ncbi:MAG: hypothetical protein SNJ77_04035 [Cytophagales bacterium]
MSIGGNEKTLTLSFRTLLGNRKPRSRAILGKVSSVPKARKSGKTSMLNPEKQVQGRGKPYEST